MINPPESSDSTRLDDAITWFLGSWPYEGPRVPTKDTIRTYSYQLKWLSNYAISRGKVLVADIDEDLLRGAFQSLLTEQQERSPIYKGGEAVASSLASATNRLLGWLGAQRVPVPDVSKVRPPRPPERIQPRLTPEQFRALETAALHQLVEPARRSPQVSVSRDLALLYLLAETGLRATELLAAVEQFAEALRRL